MSVSICECHTGLLEVLLTPLCRDGISSVIAASCCLCVANLREKNQDVRKMRRDGEEISERVSERVDGKAETAEPKVLFTSVTTAITKTSSKVLRADRHNMLLNHTRTDHYKCLQQH